MSAQPSVHVESLEFDCHAIVFDREGSSANIFNRRTFEDLIAALDRVESADTQGVVFISAKPSIFIAGADIHEIMSQGRDQLDESIHLGQNVFNRIESMSAVTVAAIHGACLGGGFELCLACDYRVASDDRKTRIGLPETHLGILPAWGGSTRLPRLIGLPKAVAAVLQAKRYTARHAKAMGLVDDVVPHDHLRAAAMRRVCHGKRPPSRHVLTNNPLVSRIVEKRASKDLRQKTRGLYPAPVSALRVMVDGVGCSIGESLEHERAAVLALAATSQCRNLVRVYTMQEGARKLSLPGVTLNGYSDGLQRCAVIGAGVMGSGIAQWISARGHSVLLRDINDEQVAHGLETIAGLFRSGLKRRTFTRRSARDAFDRITPSSHDVPLTHTDLVIEAAVERMDLKKQVFAQLEAQANESTILATNTSALSVTELAESLEHPERVIGIHFFNPVSRMMLVEIITTSHTDDAVTQAVIQWVQGIGKLPVVVKDSPGFLVNRILMPYLVEAGLLFDEGIERDRIDDAMLDFGMPMGPLRLIDEVGADVALHVAETLAESMAPRFVVPHVLRRLVRGGFLGRKSGSGFYCYDDGEPVRPNEAVIPASRKGAAEGMEIASRLALMMVNEAAMCLDEGIVAEPEQVDLAMIMGTGFAPFRGGPMRYADTLGAATCLKQLTTLSGRDGARYTPSARLAEMARVGTRFYETEGDMR